MQNKCLLLWYHGKNLLQLFYKYFSVPGKKEWQAQPAVTFQICQSLYQPQGHQKVENGQIDFINMPTHKMFHYFLIHVKIIHLTRWTKAFPISRETADVLAKILLKNTSHDMACHCPSFLGLQCYYSPGSNHTSPASGTWFFKMLQWRVYLSLFLTLSFLSLSATRAHLSLILPGNHHSCLLHLQDAWSLQHSS